MTLQANTWANRILGCFKRIGCSAIEQPLIEIVGNDDFTDPTLFALITIAKCLQVLFFSLQYVLIFVVRG